MDVKQRIKSSKKNYSLNYLKNYNKTKEAKVKDKVKENLEDVISDCSEVRQLKDQHYKGTSKSHNSPSNVFSFHTNAPPLADSFDINNCSTTFLSDKTNDSLSYSSQSNKQFSSPTAQPNNQFEDSTTKFFKEFLNQNKKDSDQTNGYSLCSKPNISHCSDTNPTISSHFNNHEKNQRKNFMSTKVDEYNALKNHVNSALYSHCFKPSAPPDPVNNSFEELDKDLKKNLKMISDKNIPCPVHQLNNPSGWIFTDTTKNEIGRNIDNEKTDQSMENVTVAVPSSQWIETIITFLIFGLVVIVIIFWLI